MKNFVIALAIMLMASVGLQAQQKTSGNISYIGCKVEQIQKDFPKLQKLSADNSFVRNTPVTGAENYGSTWVAYGVNLGDGQSVRYFKFMLDDGLCYEEQIHTFNKTVALAVMLVYEPYLSGDLDADGNGVLPSVPNNPNKMLLFAYRKKTSPVTSPYYVFEITAFGIVEEVK